jgi:serine/threonine protein kinase
MININFLQVVSCGEVHEASWRGTRVAVKKIFRALLHGSSMQEFQMESDMLRYVLILQSPHLCLRRLRHPSIVLWMGTCVQGSEMCIVTEFIDRGSLRQVLSDNDIKLEWTTILSMAVDAARGNRLLLRQWSLFL